MFGRGSSVRSSLHPFFDRRPTEVECEAIHGDPYIAALLGELAVIEARLAIAGSPRFRGMPSFSR